MKIGVTGASGFVGKRVKALAESGGHEVVAFSRNPQAGGRIFRLDSPPDLSGLDAVIHLAGERVLGLWTAGKKKQILESRVEGTRRVVEAMASNPDGPRILISASAIGYYGDTGEEIVDENSKMGRGFLAEVCRDWEAEALRAEDCGIRVACLRIGFVLGREAAMTLIEPVFRLGLGGTLGNGRQWMSGVHVDDVAGMFLWAAENPEVRGIYNSVLPEPFRNQEFTREIARIVRRPAFLPAPAFLLRLALGELSGVMLDSMRVKPVRTLENGYVFQFATLREALQDVLKG